MSFPTEFPMQPAHYSAAFKIVSAISGVFTLVVSYGVGSLAIMDDPEGNASRAAIAFFTFATYLYIQITVAGFERRHETHRRARTYFWLLASYPLWCLPSVWTILEVFHYVAKRA
jgi:hypothetical protein